MACPSVRAGTHIRCETTIFLTQMLGAQLPSAAFATGHGVCISTCRSLRTTYVRVEMVILSNPRRNLDQDRITDREWHHRTVNGRRIVVSVHLPNTSDLSERIRVIRRAVAEECRRRWGEGHLQSGLLGLKWCRETTPNAHGRADGFSS